MRLVHLGHATWLLEAARLRILFDPILGPTHSGGTFSIVPRRRLEPRSLRPDFIFVSHAHPDHFDPESLAALAKADPDSVLVTSDALIAEVAGIVGFRTVRQIAPGTRIDLDGDLALVTTPSRAPDVEWGVVAMDASGVVWNMIDTVFESPAEVRTLRNVATAKRGVDLALAPIQPMREIALATAGLVGFDPRQYAHMLSCALAVESKTVVPSAAGDAHAPPFTAMNSWVYPVCRERAARDFAALATPGTRILLPDLGDALVVEGGATSIEAGAFEVERLGDDPSRAFRPLEPAPLRDPDLPGHGSAAYRARIDPWVRDVLAPSLARSLSGREDLGDIRFVLEVIYPDSREAFTLDRRGGVRDGGDEEYEVLDVVAASMFWEVIEGRRGWGEVLLAGLLRSSIRGVSTHDGTPRPLAVAPMFLYYALSYAESLRRAALHRARSAA